MAILESIKPIQGLTDRSIKNFWRKVQKSDDPEGCWEWTGALSDRGYGVFTTPKPYKRTVKAHRVGYYLGTGIDPIYYCCLHKCDNPRCVRFSHMMLGDQQDNLDDMYRKGRGPTGDKNSKMTHPEKIQRGKDHWCYKYPEKFAKTYAKLVLNRGKYRGGQHWKATIKEEDIVKIRGLSATMQLTEIAKIYGVTKTCIWSIVRRKSWKHIP